MLNQFTEGDKTGRGDDIDNPLNAAPSYALTEPSLNVGQFFRLVHVRVCYREQNASYPNSTHLSAVRRLSITAKMRISLARSLMRFARSFALWIAPELKEEQ